MYEVLPISTIFTKFSPIGLSFIPNDKIILWKIVSLDELVVIVNGYFGYFPGRYLRDNKCAAILMEKTIRVEDTHVKTMQTLFTSYVYNPLF